VQLRNAGITVAIISGRDSPMVSTRLKELGVAHVQQGSRDKHGGLQKLLTELQLKPTQVACVGDDTPDLPMFSIGHLNVAVADAHQTVRNAAHYVTQLSGGVGAVREVCDLILQAQTPASAS
jgi:3-deoxy-D-manno-octulosonate 8-phosphate phosphatase (KDO 8-P phosphatase)